MNGSIGDRLHEWNARMGGLPERCLLIALTLLLCALFIFLLPYFLPLAAAWLLSSLLEPLVRRLIIWLRRVKLFGRAPGRSAATLIGMLLLFGVAGWLMAALFLRVTRELTALARSLPQLLAAFTETALPRLRELYYSYSGLLPDYISRLAEGALGSLGDTLMKWAGTISAAVTSGAWSTAASIPGVLLSVVLTIMSTYYLTADRARIRAFFVRLLPVPLMGRGRLIRARLFRALRMQVRSQLTVSLIVTAFLVILLTLFRVRYGLVAGLLIGVFDALPVLGAGLFLIPWSLLGFLTGDTGTGALMALAYLGTVVIRQIAEPRIVGKNLGLYPLAAMTAMYAGYRLMGFAGLLIGPVLLNILKVVLDAEEAAKQQ